MWVESRRPFDDLTVPENKGVAVVTFHAAKGREWDAVVVTGVEEGLVPHGSATNAAQRAEEARLLYVAITRARTELTVTAAAERGGRPVGPSPWLDAVRSVGEVDRPVPPPHHTPRATPDPLAALRAWRGNVARVAGVADIAVCSDRVLRTLLDDPPPDTDDARRPPGPEPHGGGPAAAPAVMVGLRPTVRRAPWRSRPPGVTRPSTRRDQSGTALRSSPVKLVRQRAVPSAAAQLVACVTPGYSLARACFISSKISWGTAMNRPVA